MADQSKAESYFDKFPPGYRFKPYDYELLNLYLVPKLQHKELPPNQINDVELYKHNPDYLAGKYKPQETDQLKEWYFFTPRERKYKNGQRPKRKAGEGYWKATGSDKRINDPNGNKVGLKKSLVFYKGNPPKGDKTDWIMQEFRSKAFPKKPVKNSNDMQLDEWVLCKMYKTPKKFMHRNGKNQSDDLADVSTEALDTNKQTHSHVQKSDHNPRTVPTSKRARIEETHDDHAALAGDDLYDPELNQLLQVYENTSNYVSHCHDHWNLQETRIPRDIFEMEDDFFLILR